MRRKKNVRLKGTKNRVKYLTPLEDHEEEKTKRNSWKYKRKKH